MGVGEASCEPRSLYEDDHAYGERCSDRCAAEYVYRVMHTDIDPRERDQHREYREDDPPARPEPAENHSAGEGGCCVR